MALSDKLTRTQLRALIRREIMDSGTQWIADADLNTYLEDWQDQIQSELELVWASTTFTNTGSSTLTLTNVATDIHRIDAIYLDGCRLIEKSKEQLEQEIGIDWRNTQTATPQAYYQDTHTTVSFWPPAISTATFTMVFEYPATLTFASDTSTHSLPAWTNRSAVTYGAMRSFARRGQIFNADKSNRYRAIWNRQFQRFKVLKDRYFPKRSWSTIPGATKYEIDMMNLKGSRYQYE